MGDIIFEGDALAGYPVHFQVTEKTTDGTNASFRLTANIARRQIREAHAEAVVYGIAKGIPSHLPVSGASGSGHVQSILDRGAAQHAMARGTNLSVGVYGMGRKIMDECAVESPRDKMRCRTKRQRGLGRA